MDNKDSVGLSDYISALRRRRRLAAMLGAPIFLIALAVALGLPSVYRSTAVFKLNDAQGNQDQQPRGGDSYADRYISGLTAIVLRYDNLKKAVEEIPLPPGADKNQAMADLSKSIKAEMVTEKILDPDSGRERVINSGFSVSVDNRDPQLAWRQATWASDAFIRASREYALSQATSQSAFFASEAERVRLRIAALEAKLADFKRKNFDQLPETAQANLNVRSQVDQELSGIERELSTLEQNRAFAQQQLQQALTSNNGATLAQLQAEYDAKATTYSADHPDLIALRHQIDALKHSSGGRVGNSLQAQLQMQKSILAETRQRYSEDHPDVKRIEKAISTLEARIAAGEKTSGTDDTESSPLVSQLKVQVHALDAQIAAAQGRAGELRAQRNQLLSHMASTPEVERNYQEITRDLGTARAQYDQLMNHRMDSDVKSAAISSGEVDKFSIVQPAVLPDAPAKPARIAIVLLGLIGAAVVALMGTVIAEAIDPAVRGARDIRHTLDVLPLSAIPKIRNAASMRRRRREMLVAAMSVLVAVPLLYVVVRLVAR